MDQETKKQTVLNVVFIDDEVEILDRAFEKSGLRAKAEFIRYLVNKYNQEN